MARRTLVKHLFEAVRGFLALEGHFAKNLLKHRTRLSLSYFGLLNIEPECHFLIFGSLNIEPDDFSMGLGRTPEAYDAFDSVPMVDQVFSGF